ncbi:MAG TPA: PilN domain-containing protein [Vicinamibacterales bacterium]|nr:PilN domain-containing protein [Vicinamibacterales bacterium]
MLRANLSTRPFYNERAVHFVLIIAAALVLGVTLVNVVTLLRLSRHNTELSSGIRQDRAEADRLTREAAEIRRGIDQKELQLVVNAAREANTLIDRRTFSWTAFFNHLEATMPADVMLRSVRPGVDRGVTRVSMVVLARRYQDAEEFQQNLEQTGAFEEVVTRQQVETEEGLQQVTLEAIYRPGGEPAPPPAEAPAVRR